MVDAAWLAAVPVAALPAAVLPTSAPGMPVHAADVIRVVVDTLDSLGLRASAAVVQRESGVALRSSAAVAAARAALLDGDWPAVLAALPALPLRHGGEAAVVLYAVLRQQLLEALEVGDALTALVVLRDQLPAVARALACAAGRSGGGAAASATPAAVLPLFAATPPFPPLAAATLGDGGSQVQRVLYFGASAAADGAMPARDVAPPPLLADAHRAALAPGDVLAGALASTALLLREPVATDDAGAPPAGGDVCSDCDGDARDTDGDGDSEGDAGDGDAGGGDAGDGEADAAPAGKRPRVSPPSPTSAPQTTTLEVATAGGRVTLRLPPSHVAPLLPLDARERRVLNAGTACAVTAAAAPGRLAGLAALLVVTSPAALRLAAAWSGAAGGSRDDVLHLLERRLCADVVPPLRLHALLGQALSYQRSMCALHTGMPRVPSLLRDHVCTGAELPTRAARVVAAHTDEVWGVALAPDARRVVTTAASGEVAVWDCVQLTANSRRRVAPLARWVPHVAVSTHLPPPAPAPPPVATNEALTAAVWDATGSLLVSASGSSSVVAVWDAATGGCLAAGDTGCAAGVVSVAVVTASHGVGAPLAVTLLVAGNDERAAGVVLLALHRAAGAAAGATTVTPLASWRTPPVRALACVPRGSGAPCVAVALTDSGHLAVINVSDPAAPVALQDVAGAGSSGGAGASPATTPATTPGSTPATYPAAFTLDATGRYALLTVPGAPPPPQYRPGTLPLGTRAVTHLSPPPLPPPPPPPPPPRASTGIPVMVESLLGVGSAAAGGGMAPVAGRQPYLHLLPVPAPAAGATTAGAAAATATAGMPAAAAAAASATAPAPTLAPAPTRVPPPPQSNAPWARGWARDAACVVVWDLCAAAAVARVGGHVNERAMLQPTFCGGDGAVVACGSEDSVVYLWHRDRGVLLAQLPGHAGTASAVAWLPPLDGSDAGGCLLSAGDDGTLRTWVPTAAADSI